MLSLMQERKHDVIENFCWDLVISFLFLSLFYMGLWSGKREESEHQVEWKPTRHSGTVCGNLCKMSLFLLQTFKVKKKNKNTFCSGTEICLQLGVNSLK